MSTIIEIHMIVVLHGHTVVLEDLMITHLDILVKALHVGGDIEGKDHLIMIMKDVIDNSTSVK